MAMYDREFQYLIHLVRCAIHDITPSELPDGVLFDSVYKLGSAQGVANIAYHSVKKLEHGPDEQLLRKWGIKESSAVVTEMNQTFAADEIRSAFKESGIDVKEVQGTVIRKLYPRPEFRTMSDLDFIIKPDDLEAAREILESLGYECKPGKGLEVNGFRAPNIYVELHTEYFPEDSDYHKAIGDPFGESDLLPNEELYVYSVLHTAKHYSYAGCGIRRVLDIYLLNEKFGDIHKNDRVRELLADAGAFDFLEAVSEIGDCFFGETERIPDDRHLPMIEKLVRSKIHGTSENKIEGKLQRTKDKGKGGVKLRYVLSRIFPDRDTMVHNYPVLKKWGILMPFCAVHRWIKAIAKNRKRLGGELRDLKKTKLK